MDKVLIDTDVLLDFFYDRKPFSPFAIEILNLCETKIIDGFTTPLIICNVYYLLRKSARHDIVIEKLKQLLTIITVIEIDQDAVLSALNSDFKDFEDAIQNFAAIENDEIKFIITRNTKDFKKSTLAIVTPEIYLKSKNTL